MAVAKVKGKLQLCRFVYWNVSLKNLRESWKKIVWRETWKNVFLNIFKHLNRCNRTKRDDSRVFLSFKIFLKIILYKVIGKNLFRRHYFSLITGSGLGTFFCTYLCNAFLMSGLITSILGTFGKSKECALLGLNCYKFRNHQLT